jgi:hypothetical protein
MNAFKLMTLSKKKCVDNYNSNRNRDTIDLYIKSYH